jgi:hypothetical protein
VNELSSVILELIKKNVAVSIMPMDNPRILQVTLRNMTNGMYIDKFLNISSLEQYRNDLLLDTIIDLEPRLFSVLVKPNGK